MSVERLENCAKSTGMSLLITEMLIYVDDLDLRTQAVWAVDFSRRAKYILIDQLCCYEKHRHSIFFNNRSFDLVMAKFILYIE